MYIIQWLNLLEETFKTIKIIYDILNFFWRLIFYFYSNNNNNSNKFNSNNINKNSDNNTSNIQKMTKFFFV